MVDQTGYYCDLSQKIFSSMSSVVSSLTFRSLMLLSLFLCIMLEIVLVSVCYLYLFSFPAPLNEETIFSPLYIFAFLS